MVRIEDTTRENDNIQFWAEKRIEEINCEGTDFDGKKQLRLFWKEGYVEPRAYFNSLRRESDKEIEILKGR